jgi:hypothetical protein
MQVQEIVKWMSENPAVAATIVWPLLSGIVNLLPSSTIDEWELPRSARTALIVSSEARASTLASRWLRSWPSSTAKPTSCTPRRSPRRSRPPEHEPVPESERVVRQVGWKTLTTPTICPWRLEGRSGYRDP